MSNVKKIIPVCVLMGLSGCASVHQEPAKVNSDYIKQAQTVPSAKIPQDTGIQSYYPIPPVNRGEQQPQQVSITPPGSQMAQNQAQQTSAATRIGPIPSGSMRAIPVASPGLVTRAPTVIASSSNALVLSAPFPQAWEQVGRGLHAAGYKVMQQDKSMGAYYLLDLGGTSGVLKTSTPIYQLHLKSSGNNTSVSLYDDKGNPASAQVGTRILGALKKNL